MTRPMASFKGIIEPIASPVEAIKDFQPMQPGDVVATAADTSALEAWVCFQPNTPLELGLERFSAWVKANPIFFNR